MPSAEQGHVFPAHTRVLGGGPPPSLGPKPLMQGEPQPCKAAHPVCCPEAGSCAAQLGAHSACGLWLGPLLGPGIWEGLACVPGARPQWATMNVAEREGSLAVGGERS